MDNGFYLRSCLFSAINGWHKAGTATGLGNRRSILLSYGANGSFPRFPPVTGQPRTRRRRRGGLGMSAQEVAQPLPECSRLPNVLNLPRGGLWDIERAKVYFMFGAGLIKIGVTTDVDGRWRSLNNACPVPIDLLGYFLGTQVEEREMHAEFKHLRVRGEWFKDAPELRAAIREKCGEIWERRMALGAA